MLFMTIKTKDEVLRIIKLRLKGKTQVTLAEELNISPGYLCDILAGKRGISEMLAEKLGFAICVGYKSKKGRK